MKTKVATEPLFHEPCVHYPWRDMTWCLKRNALGRDYARWFRRSKQRNKLSSSEMLKVCVMVTRELYGEGALPEWGSLRPEEVE